jgi:ubiquinone/menaquinone biosynthesis C-methylase UbiE
VSEKERVRAIFEKDAPKYDRSMGFWERALLGDVRRWACSRAQGETLEIAIGTGLNLPYYAADVRLTGIEFSPAMLDIARRRATELGRDVDLRLGDAEQLEFADESFDTVVCTYGLCTIPDDGEAVREARRVLRPGGALVLAEHVRSPGHARTRRPASDCAADAAPRGRPPTSRAARPRTRRRLGRSGAAALEGRDR